MRCLVRKVKHVDITTCSRHGHAPVYKDDDDDGDFALPPCYRTRLTFDSFRIEVMMRDFGIQGEVAGYYG